MDEYSGMIRGVSAIVCAALVAVFGCSSSSENPTTPACTPGATRACTLSGCPIPGSQACNSDGQSYSACACGAGGSGGGAAGSGGTSAAGAGGSDVGGAGGSDVGGAGGSDVGGAGGGSAGVGGCVESVCELRASCCDQAVSSGVSDFHTALVQQQTCSDPSVPCHTECGQFCNLPTDFNALGSCVYCLNQQASSSVDCASTACNEFVSCASGCTL
jgi:hypothetical protein